MKEIIRKKTAASPVLRWTVVGLVSFTMLTGYVIADVMAPLKTLLEQQLGWDSSDYGLFTSGYGWLNIFLLMLIFGGMILDKKGVRYAGVLSVGLMIGGTLLKYWAITADLGGAVSSFSIGGHSLFSVKSQVLYATLGFAVFGVGVEMIGITANKAVVKWFRGRSLALALGINVAAGRIGTAIAMFGSLPLARMTGNPGAPLAVCLLLLCIGLLSFLVFCVLDRREDRETETLPGTEKEEEFKLSDIVKIAKIKAFWYITILCVLFYSAVFPFLKYATELMIQKFHVSPGFAGAIPALLPFGNILLTPLFGSIYDRRGHGGYDHADRLGAAGLRIHSVRDPGAHGKLDGRRAGTGTRSRPFAGAVGHVAFGDENRPVPDAGHLLFDDFLDTELGPGLRPAVDRRRAQEPLHHRHRRDRRRGIHALRLHAADADLRRIRGAIDRLRAAAAP